MANRIVLAGVIALLVVLLVFDGVLAQSKSSPPGNVSLRKTNYSVDELLTWTRRGQGYVNDFRGEALQMAEQEGSRGLILSSPGSFGQRTIVRYRMFTLTPGTVLVTMLSASNHSDTRELTIPKQNRGGAGYWVNDTSNYFFAYHNAAHMKKPFVVRFDRGEKTSIARAREWRMTTGRWYDVEVGRWKDRLWLKINDHRLFQGTDPEPASGGHVVLRIRGTGLQQANCLIRDLRILTPP